jgi:SNF2 family DNA or RNA helicase
MNVHIRGNRLVIPAHKGALGLFPEAQPLVVQGRDLLVLNHGLPETVMLRRFGFDVPAPVISQYDWAGGKPYEVQIKTVALMTTSRRCYVLNGMGTGKTKSALWSYDYLRGLGLAHKMLVVGKLSTLEFTWLREVFETTPHLSAVVLTGTAAKRKKLLAQEHDIYIINHDGVETIIRELEKRKDIDTLVLDELAAYRNGSTDRTKMMRKYAVNMAFCWGLTGSPIPKGPEGAWGQCSIITPHTVPKYFKHWRDSVKTKVSQFTYIDKPDALERVLAVMRPAVRFSLDDVLELPECIERDIDVPLGPIQAKIYKDMKNNALARIGAGEITAMNAGAVLSKLLQISSGYVYTREGQTVTLDGNDRLDQLEQDIDDTQRKAIVFVPFKHTLAGVSEFLTSKKIDHASVSGDTSAKERGNIFSDFQETARYKVLLAHPACCAHGLTLTAADTVIWFAPVPSLEIYEQANARIRRIGQKHKQQVLHYQGTPAERKIYKLLKGHADVQSRLLEMFAELTD